MLLVLLPGVMLQFEVQAFYNPSSGRWLSRDPIEERGGKNLMASNNSLNNSIDVLGLYPTTSFFICLPLCGKIPYYPAYQCCKDGKVYGLNKTVGTGVFKCSYRPLNPTQAWLAHTWIEWPGGSAGYNAPGNPGQWASPDPNQSYRDQGVSCEEIKVRICESDPEAYKNCIASSAGSQPGSNFQGRDCVAYAGWIVDKCK